MRRRLLGALVLGALSALGCATQAPAPRDTAVRLFAPFGPGRVLAPGTVVAARLEGTCFAESVASDRPDAWRCMAGNRILDPCFEGSAEGAVVLACARSPWEEGVALFTPTAALPEAKRRERALLDALPWALELADGSRCTLLTGATSAVAGLRVNYGCQGGKLWVLGDVDRRGSAWLVFTIAAEGGAAEQRVVATAWY